MALHTCAQAIPIVTHHDRHGICQLYHSLHTPRQDVWEYSDTTTNHRSYLLCDCRRCSTRAKVKGDSKKFKLYLQTLEINKSYSSQLNQACWHWARACVAKSVIFRLAFGAAFASRSRTLTGFHARHSCLISSASVTNAGRRKLLVVIN